ncbi:hypothetical protein D9611_005932 [Ephemerocybe angulata]|uniref:Uncharacterized protein n=1 Tax=Ephemerocybe angulata TaxID=980116 RepID=A0A8H5CFY8_9AGAR|nr:hypothetical protein D9611_005932 [Tulosesus angulatus]
MVPPFDGPIAAFFSTEHPDFPYNPRNSASFEFRRLCHHRKWKGEKYAAERTEAYEAFQDALAQQFNARYGTDADRVEPWQNLCRTLGLPIPEELKEAREAVFNTHVNLVDLTEAGGGRTFTLFETEQELSSYTLETGKIMSSRSASIGGVLKALLRHILHPPRKALARDQFGQYIREENVEKPQNGAKEEGKKKKKKRSRNKRKKAKKANLQSGGGGTETGEPSEVELLFGQLQIA